VVQWESLDKGKRDFDPIDLRTSDLCDGVSSFG